MLMKYEITLTKEGVEAYNGQLSCMVAYVTDAKIVDGCLVLIHSDGSSTIWARGSWVSAHSEPMEG